VAQRDTLRHTLPCTAVGMGVSCSADRQALGKITKEVWLVLFYCVVMHCVVLHSFVL
jgi:hypothetical protein